MISEWITEIGTSFLRLFMNPLFYFLIFSGWFIGFMRIKNERKLYHTKILDITSELGMVLFQGIGVGLFLSIITMGLGVTVPLSFPTLMILAVLLLCMTMKWKFLAPVYLIGLIIVIGVTSVVFKGTLNLTTLPQSFEELEIYNLLILLTLLLLAESILVRRYGGKNTSPSMLKGRRGHVIGGHFSNKLWVLPLFLLVPESTLQAIPGYWPVLHSGASAWGFICLPIPIGYSFFSQSDIPKLVAKKNSQLVLRVFWFALMGSMVAYFLPQATMLALGIISAYYIFMTFKIQAEDSRRRPYFTQKNKGIIVLGILPHSPAYEMELEIGEMIIKVNGYPVWNMDNFYQALHTNRAHVKLEVVDCDGQIRHINRALHTDDHHELGIISIKNIEGLAS